MGTAREGGKSIRWFRQKLIAKLYGLCEWSVSGLKGWQRGLLGGSDANHNERHLPLEQHKTDCWKSASIEHRVAPCMGVVWPISRGASSTPLLSLSAYNYSLRNCLLWCYHSPPKDTPLVAMLSCTPIQCFVWFVNSWSALVVAIVDTFKCRLLLSASSTAGGATCT